MRYSKLKAQNSALALLVLAFVLIAALYSAVVPLGEGPDEPGHAAYAFFLARERRLPVQRAERAKSDVPGEGHQPPLAYALAAPLVAWLPADQRAIDQPGNPRFVWSGGSEPNAVAHGSREFWPWRGAVLAWHLARLASVACGAATIVFAYLAARSLERRWTMGDGRWTGSQLSDANSSSIVYRLSPVPLLAAALVAFNPQFLFVSALVTNDALLAALSAAMLWLAVWNPERRRDGAAEGDRSPERNEPSVSDRRHRYGSEGRQETGEGSSLKRFPLSVAGKLDRGTRREIAIGLVLGLALLTKQSALILAPVALISVMRPARRGLPPLRRSGASAFRVLLAALLVCGWWYLRNLRLYGDLFGLAAFQAEFTTQAFDPGRLDAWIAGLKQLHSSFWARFGWMNVRPPGWTIWFFTAVEVAAMVGWLLRGSLSSSRNDKETRSQGDKETIFPRSPGLLVAWSSWWPILALPVLAFAWVVSFALTAGLVAWQGRLAFPALPAIAILLAFGLSAWGRATNDGRRTTDDGRRTTSDEPRATNDERRTASDRGDWKEIVGGWSLVVGLLAIAAWLPFGAIRPAYTIHTLPEQVALARLGTPIYGRLARPGDPGAELRGWRLDGSARPGQTLDLTLTWHALGRQDRNWTVFVHLVDARENIVAEDNREPRDGAFPAKQWVAGDWIEDRHPLALPAGLAPGTYELRVGMWYPRTGRRAAVYNENNKLSGDHLEITRITVSNTGITRLPAKREVWRAASPPGLTFSGRSLPRTWPRPAR